MRKPRVLVLSELYPYPGNPVFGTFVARQSEALADRCDIVVVSPLRVVPPLRLLRRLARPRRGAAVLRDWWRQIQKRPAVTKIGPLPVHYPRYLSPPRQLFHGLWGFFAYPLLHRTLRRLHRERPFDLIHAHYATPAGVIALLAARWMGVPVVLSVHGMDLSYTVRQRPIGRAVVEGVLRRVDLILANSRQTERALHRHGAPPERTQLLWLGGDLPAPSAPPPPRDPRPFRLLSVGYLTRQKGHQEVLEAMAQLVAEGFDLHYTIVGEGPERARLVEQIAALALQTRVTLAGAQPREALASYYEASDLFVQPSLPEAFGLVYLEALGMGRPAIGCEGAGGPEDLAALADCVDLVPPRAPVPLAAAIRRQILEPERRLAMGARGRALVASEFSWARTGERTMAAYASLLSRRRRPTVERSG